MQKPVSIPKAPTVVILRRANCPHVAGALELLGFTGAKIEIRELDEMPSPEARETLLRCSADAREMETELEKKRYSLAWVVETERAAPLTSRERVLELFQMRLPPGETEGSFMRRVLQGRVV